MKQIPGKMYLADQRGITETPQFRRYSTFNFGEYVHEHRQPLGRLRALNEEMLGAGQRMPFEADQPYYVVLLPITGETALIDEQGYKTSTDVGEMLIHRLPEKQTFQLVNPYPTDPIHFLQLWIKADQPFDAVSSQLFSYDLQAIENQLREITTGVEQPEPPCLPFSVSVGRFAGRQETTHQLKSTTSSFFAFVIAGAFEVEGRLLHENDGLALWDTEVVEVEALSEQALLLVLEMEEAQSSTVGPLKSSC